MFVYGFRKKSSALYRSCFSLFKNYIWRRIYDDCLRVKAHTYRLCTTVPEIHLDIWWCIARLYVFIYEDVQVNVNTGLSCLYTSSYIISKHGEVARTIVRIDIHFFTQFGLINIFPQFHQRIQKFPKIQKILWSH